MKFLSSHIRESELKDALSVGSIYLANESKRYSSDSPLLEYELPSLLFLCYDSSPRAHIWRQCSLPADYPSHQRCQAALVLPGTMLSLPGACKPSRSVGHTPGSLPLSPEGPCLSDVSVCPSDCPTPEAAVHGSGFQWAL
jgi:hypothetical protein